MSYTIKQLADLAGISVRTLHFYDEIGLLRPARERSNKYRIYEEKELLRLQQILFFRELDFPTKEIKRILSAPGFDMSAALKDQKRLIELKKERLNRLIKTIDKTIQKINQEISMDNENLYDSFNKEEMEKYAKEAKERWGHTDEYKQSTERVNKMSKDDMARIQAESDALMKEIASRMSEGSQSKMIQELIDKHYDNLKHFYEPSLELYRGLADMYVSDKRFSAYFDKYATGLAQFMHDAMIIFCDSQK
jgi:MerR family transcriptional regulator, thiopeptide resistance regulator